ncbi:MAG TPA: PilZ domain-containing protein [Geothrix sp.]|nr:PilZ domain-containing protein [Geothrix sp.]
MAYSESRQFPRFPISYQVKLVVEDRIIAFSSAIDLSMGGILVSGDHHLNIGTECGVAILLGKGEPGRRVVTRGTVVRVDTRGTALAFSRTLDASSADSLRTLIGSLTSGVEPELEPIKPPDPNHGDSRPGR